MTAPENPTSNVEQAIGYVDLCASCSSPVKTFANLQIARDEKHLVPTWMPPGGCTCQSLKPDPECPRCFPPLPLCHPCGERRSG
jgi:hypothetical protein